MTTYIKNSKGERKIAYVEPYVKNSEILFEKVAELNGKWDEIQQLIEDINGMECPIEYRSSWEK